MVLGIVAFNCYRRDNHFKDKFEEIRGCIYFSKTFPGKNKAATLEIQFGLMRSSFHVILLASSSMACGDLIY